MDAVWGRKLINRLQSNLKIFVYRTISKTAARERDRRTFWPIKLKLVVVKLIIAAEAFIDWQILGFDEFETKSF